MAIGHWGRHSLAQTSGRIFAILLVILWAFAAGFLTAQKGPFTSACETANGASFWVKD